ncbi:hypothetical protein BGZ80_008660, partial [Entomortierella chlamydospora]
MDHLPYTNILRSRDRSSPWEHLELPKLPRAILRKHKVNAASMLAHPSRGPMLALPVGPYVGTPRRALCWLSPSGLMLALPVEAD